MKVELLVGKPVMKLEVGDLMVFRNTYDNEILYRQVILDDHVCSNERKYMLLDPVCGKLWTTWDNIEDILVAYSSKEDFRLVKADKLKIVEVG